MVPPRDAYHIVVPGGEAFVWLPHPGIAAQKAIGVLSLPLAEAFGAFYRRLYRPDAHVTVGRLHSTVTSRRIAASVVSPAATLRNPCAAGSAMWIAFETWLTGSTQK